MARSETVYNNSTKKQYRLIRHRERERELRNRIKVLYFPPGGGDAERGEGVDHTCKSVVLARDSVQCTVHSNKIYRGG